MMMRGYSCLNCWETRNSSLPFSIEVLFMVGGTMSSTQDVMVRAIRFLFSKFNSGTASVATLIPSGQLPATIFMIPIQCCLTSLNKGSSKANFHWSIGYVVAIVGLVLEQLGILSYLQVKNHLISMGAIHLQTALVIASQLIKLVKICSLMRRLTASE
jgi:hypothetical protein